jgi:hypothetical protein
MQCGRVSMSVMSVTNGLEAGPLRSTDMIYGPISVGKSREPAR